METNRFPNRLKNCRNIHGYTQKQIGNLLGFKNTDRISQWEKGLAMPSALNLLKLSIIYRTLVNDFYFDLLQEYKTELTHKTDTLFASTNR
jgi:transcriptional regulator with XRE-family HTH domain